MIKFEHGGNIYQSGNNNEKWLDFSANINPLGLPESAKQAINDNIDMVMHYPDPKVAELKQAIASHYSVENKNIVVGNGASELLYLFFQQVRPRRVLVPVPAFSDYERAALAARCKVSYFELMPENDFRIDWDKLMGALPVTDCIVLGNPNNPTGVVTTRNEIVHLLDEMRYGNQWLVVDESFIDFLMYDSRYTVRDLVAEYTNLVVIQSLTKFFAMPGLRLGFGVADEKLVNQLELGKDVWNTNVLAQKAGVAALNDLEYQKASRKFIADEGEWLFKQLAQIPGITPLKSSVNFIMLNVAATGKSATRIASDVKQSGILIRDCSNYHGLNGDYLRIAVRTRAENEKLLTAINKAVL